MSTNGRDRSDTLLDAPDRVLSTLNKDGSRRWLKPRLSKGRFLTARRLVAYGLLVIYNVLPWIEMNGRPAILLNIPDREFSFFGARFLPTDTLLLMLFMVGIFLTIFLITALFGRLWCGWACPQTVYMEFVYRPLERLFLGRTPAARKKNDRTMPVRRALMYVAFALVAFHLANTFLAYFVGAHAVFEWSLGSPLNHSAAFLMVVFVTGLIMFDFSFLREQICIVMCPYGRFQSVLLDRNSLIISYDEKRGEPRGRKRGSGNGDVALRQFGDCIDCTMCVQTCPTGIDIRDGLQMECIGCAQCIDACDAVMDKIGRPRGLIRYSSQDAMESGKKRFIRPRVIVYPLLLAVVVALFLTVLLTQKDAEVTLMRAAGRPYVTLAGGEIANEVIIKIVNRTSELRAYAFEVEGVDGASIVVNGDPLVVAGGEMATANTSIILSADRFVNGRAGITVIVRDDHELEIRRHWRLQGPWGAITPPAETPHSDRDDESGEDP